MRPVGLINIKYKGKKWATIYQSGIVTIVTIIVMMIIIIIIISL